MKKMRAIRVRNSTRKGRKLKTEEFPDLVSILEYEFGKGDTRTRGGGGLESHAKLRTEVMYRAANNETKMADAREAIMALAPENLSIFLSTCFNYTQNFRKGTFEARRHHEGRGINACVSLHKAPYTAPIKDLVINIHWTSANVNYVLDEAASDPLRYCVDSRDAKQVIRANTGYGGRTWRKIETPDHTFDTSHVNAVTPMTHLLVKTKETKRSVSINKQPQLQELFLTNASRRDVVIHLKRTGKAITFLNLSYYEPETVFRSINELLHMITLPALDHFFRNPITGRLKEVLVSVVDNGIEMPRSPLVQMLIVRVRRLLKLEQIIQVSFAEYHSKRNLVEIVHAVHTKELEKHGPFQVPELHVDSGEHKTKMDEMREEVRGVLQAAKFGGEHTAVMKGIGGEEDYVFNDVEDLQKFLKMNDGKKEKCELTYVPNKNSPISANLEEIWRVDLKLRGSYADDYDVLNNYSFEPLARTAWTDKYTTVIFDETSQERKTWRQPLPDYIRWYLSGAEQHYMTHEQRKLLPEGLWDEIEGLFLPSKLLNMFMMAHPYPLEACHKDRALLCWCSEDEVKKFLANKKDEVMKEIEGMRHSARWRKHELYSKTKDQLQEMCRKNNLDVEDTKSRLVEKLCRKLRMEEPPEVEEYDGDLARFPISLKELSKLPLYLLKECLRYHDISWTGTKDQVALRVLAVRTGTAHLLFKRERDGLTEVINLAKHLIQAQRDLNVICNEFVVRQRTFATAGEATVSAERPRQTAGAPTTNLTVPVSVSHGINLESLDSVFDDLERELRLEHKKVNRGEAFNLEAVRKCEGRMLVKWTADDKREGWLPGWYSATVKTYFEKSDTAEVEYNCEPGIIYPVNVKASVENGTLRLQITTCGAVDFYEEVTEIGARILIRWEEDLKESGWRAGWYAAEIQAFNPDTDKISIIYDQEQGEVYNECVTPLISEGKVKLCK